MDFIGTLTNGQNITRAQTVAAVLGPSLKACTKNNINNKLFYLTGEKNVSVQTDQFN